MACIKYNSILGDKTDSEKTFKIKEKKLYSESLHDLACMKTYIA